MKKEHGNRNEITNRKVNVPYRDNCITTLRLLAACQVVYIHAYTHFGIQFPDLLSNILKIFMGVPFFFSTSGFLIWKSLRKYSSRGNVINYYKSRFWRIYPELWVAVIISDIIIILLTQETNYLGLLLFTFTQGTIFQPWTPSFLRSYGCGTPNGALWTICIIIQFYLLAPYLYKKLHKKKGNYRWVILISIAIVIKLLNPLLNRIMPPVLYKIYRVTIIPHLYFFVLGIFISEYWNRIIEQLTKYWVVFFVAFYVQIFVVKHDIDASSYGVITYTMMSGS